MYIFKKILVKKQKNIVWKFLTFENFNKEIIRIFININPMLFVRSFHKRASKLLTLATYLQLEVGTEYLLGQGSVGHCLSSSITN